MDTFIKRKNTNPNLNKFIKKRKTSSVFNQTSEKGALKELPFDVSIIYCNGLTSFYNLFYRCPNTEAEIRHYEFCRQSIDYFKSLENSEYCSFVVHEFQRLLLELELYDLEVYFYYKEKESQYV